jgi:hypothetical protein
VWFYLEHDARDAMTTISSGPLPVIAPTLAEVLKSDPAAEEKPAEVKHELPPPALSQAQSASAASALALVPDLVPEPPLASPSEVPAGPKLPTPEISGHMMSTMELVHTIRKSVGEMRALISKELVDAAKAEKVLIEKRQQMMRLLNNPPTPMQRQAIDALQAVLQRQLMQLEQISLYGGGPMVNLEMDRVLTDMADTLLKLSDLTQGSLHHDQIGSLHRPEREVQSARSVEITGARLGSASYLQDLKNYTDSEKSLDGKVPAHDNAERVWKMHQEGGHADVMSGGNNHFAVIRATQASQAQVQVIVNTLLDDILPPDALGEIQQGMAMLSAFNSMDLAMLGSFQEMESGGMDPNHSGNVHVRHPLSQVERDLNNSLRNGQDMNVDVRNAHGATVGRVTVHGKDLQNMHASQLVAQVRQAAADLKKEIADLMQLEQGIADMEKALAELLRLIDEQSKLLNGNIDNKQIATMGREMVHQSA